MARNFGTLCNSAAVALTAATAKTVLQILAAANIRVAVQAITVSFDGNSNTAVPVIIQVMRQSTAGTMTARTITPKDDGVSSTIQASGSENASAEPTAGAIILNYHIHPQAGAQYPLPLPGEIILAGGGRLGIKVTAPAGVNCLANIEMEE